MVKRYKTARNMSLCTEFFLVTVRSRFFYSLHEVNMPQVLRNDESQFSGNPVSKIPHKGSKITPKSRVLKAFSFFIVSTFAFVGNIQHGNISETFSYANFMPYTISDKPLHF